MDQRFQELDSLRGIAALIVVFHHFLFILPAFKDDASPENLWIDLFTHTPLHILWAGHEAVIFFFILSGFVLSLPFFKEGREFNYTDYVVKRFFRIYIPYIVSIFIAILLRLIVEERGISGLSSGFNELWENAIDAGIILSHILFLGEYTTRTFNSPIWSLIHEMRISLIFPFVVMFMNKNKLWKTVGAAAACSLVAIVLIKLTGASSKSILYSFHYLLVFVVGALLAKYRFLLLELVDKFKVKNYALFIGGILLLTYPWWFFRDFRIIHVLDDWVIILGASCIILLAFTSKAFSRFLNLKTNLFLGKISYSLYLYHMLVLLPMVFLFYGKIHIVGIFSISLLLSIIVAAIAYYWVEEPSISWGKVAIRKLRERKLEIRQVSKPGLDETAD
ncbi:acyltransferase [Planomicrobium sp. CPCC 101110]|uniref:acyltransferase family protein n=1 Tax=Planomicrobium sp. CPCC 101110 TaxID=2599619 RepID=UPI0011B412A4|nr:acyltransferase [Planomicrobium sp. CPCC 101110]TWT27731.1 acyltransferase [Planomicrobium sp. CPCC 101110]